MPRHISLLFPGQGSQSIGMLDDFDDSKINLIRKISNNLFDFDLIDVINNGPDDLINRLYVQRDDDTRIKALCFDIISPYEGLKQK